MSLPSLVRLALGVHLEAMLRLEPSRTLGAVVSAEAGQVLSSFGLLEQLQVTGRGDVGLDLVDVPDGKVNSSSEMEIGSDNTHRMYRRVLVLVRFAKMPILKIGGVGIERSVLLQVSSQSATETRCRQWDGRRGENVTFLITECGGGENLASTFFWWPPPKPAVGGHGNAAVPLRQATRPDSKSKTISRMS